VLEFRFESSDVTTAGVDVVLIADPGVNNEVIVGVDNSVVDS
jgi:hypothetical protein